MPRFYLRNFGDVLYCYDKTNDRVFKTSVENIALESEFYGPAAKGTLSLESALSEKESKHSAVLRELMRVGDANRLSEEQRIELCGFITLQYLRSKEQRMRVENMSNDLLKVVAKGLGLGDVNVRYTDSHTMALHLRTMKNLSLFTYVVAQMKLITVKNLNTMQYWTSDNPTVLFNEFDQWPFGNLGLISRGIEIHVPITPHLAIIGCDPTVFAGLPDVLEEQDPQRVFRENWLQLIYSTRFLYSDSKHFPLAKQMLRKAPEARDPSRVRIEAATGKGITASELRGRPHPTRIQKLDTWMRVEDYRRLQREFDELSKYKKGDENNSKETTN